MIPPNSEQVEMASAFDTLTSRQKRAARSSMDKHKDYQPMAPCSPGATWEDETVVLLKLTLQHVLFCHLSSAR